MAETHALWKRLKLGEFDVVLSEVTFNEIHSNLNIDKVRKLSDFLLEIHYERINVDDEVRRIADVLKKTGIIPSDKHQNDRLHIGCALVSGANVLLSMNFKHLVNVQTIMGVKGIATIEGYTSIEIIPPIMLLGKGDE